VDIADRYTVPSGRAENECRVLVHEAGTPNELHEDAGSIAHAFALPHRDQVTTRAHRDRRLVLVVGGGGVHALFGAHRRAARIVALQIYASPRAVLRVA